MTQHKGNNGKSFEEEDLYSIWYGRRENKTLRPKALRRNILKGEPFGKEVAAPPVEEFHFDRVL